MSGPKKSRWQMMQEREQHLRLMREQRRKEKIIEATTQIMISKKQLADFVSKHKEYARHTESLVNKWISEAEINITLNPNIALNSTKGIASYLAKQDIALKEKKAQDIRIAEVVKIHTVFFDDLKDQYPELYNEGIEQRVQLYRKALESNIENQDTIEHIAEYKETMLKQIEEYEKKQDEMLYIKSSLAEIIGANPEGNSMSGTINGSPINIVIHKDSHDITMNFPDEGSCMQDIETLRDEMKKSGFDLGPIRVEKTGEMLNQDYNYDYDDHKISH